MTERATIPAADYQALAARIAAGGMPAWETDLTVVADDGETVTIELSGWLGSIAAGLGVEAIVASAIE